MSLKRKLNNSELTIGSWITIGSSAIAELMSKTGGFDWLVIDMEHSVIQLAQTQELIQGIELGTATPLVRMTSNDANQIKRVMDAGAHGVIVPLINSAEDAERAVSAVYYPPKGIRGAGLARAQSYGASFDDYTKWLEENGVVVVMIEHIDGVGNVDEILSVPGVDGYIIGPYDLSASLGRPGDFDHPDVVEAINAIREGGERAGKPGGIHVVDPELGVLEKFARDGFLFIGYGMDVRFLDYICRSHQVRFGDLK